MFQWLGEPELPQGYLQRLKTSMRGAISFAERRQAKRMAEGKERVSVDITLEQAMRLLERQGFRCQLTRLLFYSMPSSGSFNPSIPSLDRIKHKGSYSVRNIRIVFLGVNAMRGTASDDDMYQIAAALTANQPGGAGRIR